MQSFGVELPKYDPKDDGGLKRSNLRSVHHAGRKEKSVLDTETDTLLGPSFEDLFPETEALRHREQEFKDLYKRGKQVGMRKREERKLAARMRKKAKVGMEHVEAGVPAEGALAPASLKRKSEYASENFQSTTKKSRTADWITAQAQAEQDASEYEKIFTGLTPPAMIEKAHQSASKLKRKADDEIAREVKNARSDGEPMAQSEEIHEAPTAPFAKPGTDTAPTPHDSILDNFAASDEEDDIEETDEKTKVRYKGKIGILDIAENFKHVVFQETTSDGLEVTSAIFIIPEILSFVQQNNQPELLHVTTKSEMHTLDFRDNANPLDQLQSLVELSQMFAKDNDHDISYSNGPAPETPAAFQQLLASSEPQPKPKAISVPEPAPLASKVHGKKTKAQPAHALPSPPPPPYAPHDRTKSVLSGAIRPESCPPDSDMLVRATNKSGLASLAPLNRTVLNSWLKWHDQYHSLSGKNKAAVINRCREVAALIEAKKKGTKVVSDEEALQAKLFGKSVEDVRTGNTDFVRHGGKA